MSSANATLIITIQRSGSKPFGYRTNEYLDINAARRDFAKVLSGNSAVIVADPDDAGFQMIPVRNITGIAVRELNPEEEREKAAGRMEFDLREAGRVRGGRQLPNG